jgi:hypothetical protein
MNKSVISILQKTFGDRAISQEDKQAFEREHGCELEEDWLEFDEEENRYYLTPEVLEYEQASKENYEALGLGDLEDQIVGALERGKTIPWGKVAFAMWIFFLFIVVYTVAETILK